MNRSRLILLCAVASLLALAPGPLQASDKSVLKEIFANWWATQGRFGSSRDVHSYELQETVELPNRPPMSLRAIRTLSDHFRFEITPAGGDTMVQAFDGRLGWQAHPQWGTGPSPDVKSDFWVWQNDLHLAGKVLRAPISFRVAARAEVAGHRCIVATFRDAAQLEGKCFFERSTRRLIRIERKGAPDVPLLAVEFDDYRPVDDLSIPFLVKVHVGNSVTVHRRSKVILDCGLDERTLIPSSADVRQMMAVDAVLKRHETSTGGAPALAAIRTRVTRLAVEVSTTGMKSSQTVSQKSPNLILLEVHTPGMGQEVRGFDGTQGWLSSELQGERPLKPTELSALLNEGTVHLVTRLRELCPFRRDLGLRTVNGRSAHAIALATYEGPQGTFCFDEETGRLLRIALPVSGDRNMRTESTIDFADFRRIDGVEIPFELVHTNPLVRVVSRVESVENNVALDDAIFRPRHED